MPGNSFGQLFRLTTFGESHGAAIGGVIDGCPPQLELDMDFLRKEMARRRPGQSAYTTARKEDDEIEWLSGLVDGVTTGAPLAFMIRNKDARSADYNALKDVYRPSHADYVYHEKYGLRDARGGGRSSARETACRVVAGAVAKLWLKQQGIFVQGFVRQIGTVTLQKDHDALDLTLTEQSEVRCPDPGKSEEMKYLINQLRERGDSTGGVIQCVINGLPVGLGEPVFDRYNALLAGAMFSINAVKGFELGSGFSGAASTGSEHNDEFFDENGVVKTRTNRSGGIQGGISNGMPVYFNVAFKPVSTIRTLQKTVNTQHQTAEIQAEGRHDPCVVPRAVPIVEAMGALVTADLLLYRRAFQR